MLRVENIHVFLDLCQSVTEDEGIDFPCVVNLR